MLTGRRVFTGETVSDTLAAVLKTRARLDRAARRTRRADPTIVAALSREGSEAAARGRVGDARLEIEEALTAPEPEAAATIRPSAPRCRRARSLHGSWPLPRVVTAGVLAIPAVRHVSEVPAAAAPEIRLEINTPPTNDPVSLAISPDGKTLVFAATSDGRNSCGCGRSMRCRPGRSQAPTADRSVLVAGQPVRGILRGRQAQADRDRRRRRAGAGRRPRSVAAARGTATTSSSSPRRAQLRSFASRRPADTPVAITQLEAPQQRTSRFAAIPARRSSLPVLRGRESRSAWRLCESTGRHRQHGACSMRTGPRCIALPGRCSS